MDELLPSIMEEMNAWMVYEMSPLAFALLRRPKGHDIHPSDEIPIFGTRAEAFENRDSEIKIAIAASIEEFLKRKLP